MIKRLYYVAFVVSGRVSFTGNNAQVEPVSTISHCRAPRKCIFGVWSSKMAKVLACIHERAGFPGLEELFSAANGYLVHHSPKGIFDVTIAFLVPENVDFGILYANFWQFGAIYYALLYWRRPSWTSSWIKPFCPWSPLSSVHPSFFYLPRSALPGSRVKMRGHLIAHMTPSAPELYRARQKRKPLGKIRYLWNSSKFFHQIYRAYRGQFRPYILQILLQYLVAFKNITIWTQIS